MNKNMPGALALLFLTACAPLVWTKPGATTASFNTDKYTCEQSATAATPNTPILTNCTMLGTCTVQDFNAGNRNQLFTDCMVAKGWSLQRQDERPRPASEWKIPLETH